MGSPFQKYARSEKRNYRTELRSLAHAGVTSLECDGKNQGVGLRGVIGPFV